jgi:hypothetical protein
MSIFWRSCTRASFLRQVGYVWIRHPHECVPRNVDVIRLTLVVNLIPDILLLVIALVGLFRLGRGGDGLFGVLWKQVWWAAILVSRTSSLGFCCKSAVWLVVATFAEVPPVVCGLIFSAHLSVQSARPYSTVQVLNILNLGGNAPSLHDLRLKNIDRSPFCPTYQRRLTSCVPSVEAKWGLSDMLMSPSNKATSFPLAGYRVSRCNADASLSDRLCLRIRSNV